MAGSIGCLRAVPEKVSLTKEMIAWEIEIPTAPPRSLVSR